MARPCSKEVAVALGIGQHFHVKSDQLRVLLPERAFEVQHLVHELIYAFKRYGHLAYLAKVIVAVFDDVAVMQIYYDVLSGGKQPLFDVLMATFRTILSARRMIQLRQDLDRPSRNPLAEALKCR
jgi:hypothetical protein